MDFNPYLAQAWASGKYTTVGAALTTNYSRGCSGAYIGVGVSAWTLDKQIDSLECVMDVVCQTNAQIATWADTSDSIKRVLTWDAAGMAAESAAAFVLWRLSGGTGR